MVGLIFAAALATAVVTDAGAVANEDLDELSGLVVSRRDPDLLWGHNDTGGGPFLYRLGPRGEDLGRVTVPHANAGDWEDIAAFADADGPALLIADVGDNWSVRTFATLYALREPAREAVSAPLLWRLDFRYPDGPRDCEAVAVDEARREILLITKRDRPARLYRLPLPPRPPQEQEMAEFVGTLAALPEVTARERLGAPLVSWFFSLPTAFDISADGLTAVFITLREAFVFRRGTGQRWTDVLRQPVEPLRLPPFEQAEAAALSADGRTLTVGGEDRPGQWARIALPATPAPARASGQGPAR